MFTRVIGNRLLLFFGIFSLTSICALGRDIQAKTIAQILRGSERAAPRVLREMLAHNGFRSALAKYNGISLLEVTSRNIPSLSISAGLHVAATGISLDKLAEKMGSEIRPQRKLIAAVVPSELVQAGTLSIALLFASLPVSAAEDSNGVATAEDAGAQGEAVRGEMELKKIPAEEEVFKEFVNGVYTYYKEYDAASWRATTFTLGFYSQYKSSTSTSEGNIDGWFNSMIWERLSNGEGTGEWWGYNDSGIRFKISKGAKVPGSSGALIPLLHFESGGSYYKYYKVSADTSGGIGFRIRTRVFKSGRKIKLLVNGGIGGLVFNPYNADTKGYINEHWEFASTYGIQFEIDRITIGDMLGIEKPTVFGLIPLIPKLNGDFREFREWKNFDKFYRMLRADIQLTDYFGLRGEYRKRQGEDHYLQFSGYVTIRDLF